jgi:hypothetical protein
LLDHCFKAVTLPYLLLVRRIKLGLMSGRHLVVKIIVESLSQHDEKYVVPTPLSGIRARKKNLKLGLTLECLCLFWYVGAKFPSDSNSAKLATNQTRLKTTNYFVVTINLGSNEPLLNCVNYGKYQLYSSVHIDVAYVEGR